MSYKIYWGNLIVDIVKKKDLDCKEFKDCWEDDYDWTELDKFVIENFRNLLIDYGEVEKERMNIKVNLDKDLDNYLKEPQDELQTIVAEKLKQIKEKKNVNMPKV